MVTLGTRWVHFWVHFSDTFVLLFGLSFDILGQMLSNPVLRPKTIEAAGPVTSRSTGYLSMKPVDPLANESCCRL